MPVSIFKLVHLPACVTRVIIFPSGKGKGMVAG